MNDATIAQSIAAQRDHYIAEAQEAWQKVAELQHQLRHGLRTPGTVELCKNHKHYLCGNYQGCEIQCLAQPGQCPLGIEEKKN